MKRGSLQLSINAIVVLVLAITMLGMGLAFTKSKFSELGERIEVPEPDYPATQDDPVVLSVNQVTVKAGDPVGIGVNFYNEGSEGCFYPCVTCDSTHMTTGNGGTAIVQELNVATGDYEPFRVLITGDPNGFTATSGTKICEMAFITNTCGQAIPAAPTCAGPVASKQFILKVQ